MDSTGCASGYATDIIMHVSPMFPKCTESLLAYWISIGFAILIRVLITFVQIRVAFHLMDMKRKSNGEARIPITTVTETFYTIASLIVFPLIGFNFVNGPNGLGPAVINISTLPFNVAYFFSCLKLVHLGDRVIPKSIRNELKNDKGSSDFQDRENLGSVRRDRVLVFLFVSTIITMILAIFFPVVMGAIVYPGKDDIYMRLGMLFYGLMNICATAIIVRQTHRVVSYIRGVTKKQNAVFGETPDTAKHGDGGKKVEEVVKRLNTRAIMICAGESIAILIYFLVVFIPFSWKIIVVLFYASNIGAIGSTLVYKPASMRIFGSNNRQKSSAVSSRHNSKNSKTTTPYNGMDLSSKQNMEITTTSMFQHPQTDVGN